MCVHATCLPVRRRGRASAPVSLSTGDVTKTWTVNWAMMNMTVVGVFGCRHGYIHVKNAEERVRRRLRSSGQ